ncbi:MAG: hypothetical protein JXM69_06340, partial [Anaerolineae bacterium]|nr:hypothetical protein [Anaerolineae bacterium]
VSSSGGGGGGSHFIYLPLISRGPTTTAGGSDLVVLDITAAGSESSVTLCNAGTQVTPDAFWVDMYFNPNPAPPPLNRTWQSITPYGADWGVTQSLAPGESLTLTIGGPHYAGGSSSFPAGAQVYAYVDSINYDTTYGNILESNENNNVFGPVVSTAGVGGAAVSASGLTSWASLPER